MKNIRKLIGTLAVLVGVVGLTYAVQTCQRTDFWCFESGPSQNLSTPARLDASGNMTLLGNSTVTGTSIQLGNILLGASGTGTSNAITAANTSVSIPIAVSTAILQGMAIIPTTVLPGATGLVNGVMSATTGSTAVIGIADAAASSGAVVNVNFSGITVALTTGAVTVGDLLVSTASTSGTVGYLATNNSASAGAIVGVALATNASTYSGLTRILLKH